MNVRAIRTIGLLLLIAVALTGCGQAQQSQPGANAPAGGGASSTAGQAPTGAGGAGAEPQSGDVYKISMNLTLSGGSAGYGIAYKNGADLAAAEINQAGGVNGKKLELVYDDNKLAPTEAVAIAQKRLDESVASIVGISGSTFLAVMPLAKEKGVPLLAPGIGTVQITEEKNPFVFRTHLNDKIGAAVVVNYLVNKLGAKKVAIIHDQNDYGVGGKNAAIEALNKLNLEPLAVESYKGGDVDFTTQLLKAKSADAVITWGLGPEQSLIAQQMRSLGIKAQIAGGAALDNFPAYAKPAGDAANGAIFITAYFPDTSNAKTKAFIDAFKAKYNQEPDVFAVNSYDSIYIIAEALKKAGGDRAKLRDAIAGIDYKGANGDYRFNSMGDNFRAVKVVQWQKGERKLLEAVAPGPFMPK